MRFQIKLTASPVVIPAEAEIQIVFLDAGFRRGDGIDTIREMQRSRPTCYQAFRSVEVLDDLVYEAGDFRGLSQILASAKFRARKYVDQLMSINSIAVEYVNCDLCGSDDQRLLYSKVDYVTGREYHLVECGCGMAFVNPMPKADCIPSLYPGDYLKDKTDLTATYDRMMEFLPRGGGKLLDIGCGQGDFIRRAQEKGWDAEGVDLLEWNISRGLKIRVGNFLEMELPEYTYDAITAWALMEHVRHPSVFFAKAARLLTERGRFIFVVPNFHAPGMRHSCTEDIPRHLWLFTPRSVTKYAERFGLKIHSIIHDDTIYTAYPFGLVRKAFFSLWGKETRCSRYDNKSVALLRNRQIKGNLREWLTQVFRSVGPLDLALDLMDLSTGILVAKISKVIGNYGVIVVIAGKVGKPERGNEAASTDDADSMIRQKKSNPK